MGMLAITEEALGFQWDRGEPCRRLADAAQRRSGTTRVGYAPSLHSGHRAVARVPPKPFPPFPILDHVQANPAQRGRTPPAHSILSTPSCPSTEGARAAVARMPSLPGRLSAAWTAGPPGAWDCGEVQQQLLLPHARIRAPCDRRSQWPGRMYRAALRDPSASSSWAGPGTLRPHLRLELGVRCMLLRGCRKQGQALEDWRSAVLTERGSPHPPKPKFHPRSGRSSFDEYRRAALVLRIINRPDLVKGSCFYRWPPHSAPSWVVFLCHRQRWGPLARRTCSWGPAVRTCRSHNSH